jgi:hypothetical protein
MGRMEEKRRPEKERNGNEIEKRHFWFTLMM